MMLGRDQRILSLYHAALEQPPPERSAFVAREAQGDPELQRGVEALLSRQPATAPHIAPPPHNEQCELVGVYRIDGVLGHGGMGVVYRATDIQLKRPAAIKFLAASLGDSGARQRFQREAQMASALNHPNILTVYGFGEHEGRQYIATEFVDGGTLDDWARDRLRSDSGSDLSPPWRRVVDLLVGVADGIATAHDANILHRDIKPANILLSKAGHAKLADFGLAKLADDARRAQAHDDGALTQTGAIIGTIDYMSPEQAAGRALDPRSDIFSFGVVLYELLAGRRPFGGASDYERLRAVVENEPLGLPDDVPEALRSVVGKALEKDPADRYQSMRELAVDLRRMARRTAALSGERVVSSAERPRARTLNPATRLGARGLLLVSSVAGVLGAIVVFFVLRDAGWLGESTRSTVAVESTSLAVMPFVNVGVATDAYLSEGLSDELRSQLSRMRSLSVIARSSSMAFKDQSVDSVAIAGKLAVATLLEGTVGRERGRIRAAVQLIDGKSGKVLWAERYDRPDADLLAVQSDIADAVVRAVLPRFAASGQAAPPLPTADPVAYDLYLLGQQKLLEAANADQTMDATAAANAAVAAEQLFRSAIAADPKFAQAHAALARALLHRFPDLTVPGQPAAADALVMPEIERALELDPGNVTAWLVKGILLRNTQRAATGGGDAYRHAYELDPSNADAITALATVEFQAGHFDERYRLALRARDVDPLLLFRHISAAIGAASLGRRDEMRGILTRMRELFPNDAGAESIYCNSVTEALGEHDEGAACALAAIATLKDRPEVSIELYKTAAKAFLSAGDAALALQYYDRAAQAGDTDAAMRAMLLRNDEAALRRQARELIDRGSVDDWEIIDALADGGLHEEALELYRQAGVADMITLESPALPWALSAVARMSALLESQGEQAEAARLRSQLLEYRSTIRAHGGQALQWRLLGAETDALDRRPADALDEIDAVVDALGTPRSVTILTGNPAFAELRDSPRFQQAVQRMKSRQDEIRARMPETFRRHGLTWPPT